MGWKQPLDTLTKEQRKFIESFRLQQEPKPKRVKPIRERRYYNPNDYIQLSSTEIERQAKELLETMKQNSDFHEENIKANQWEGTL